ncbi:MAG: lipoprotein signal peptidase [Alphaproteobacteria bacterium]|nr:MAG: lipoprotein signal peptidase [Alphaproteobacteria bacterium]
MKKNFGIFNLLLIFLIFIFFDYVSKLWAIENLFMQYRSIELTSFLSMTPVWNSGISFGFFQDSGELGRYGFTGFAFGVSIWLIYSSIKLPRYSSLGFILIASGAIGNAIDRILYGKVVDFIDFHIEDLHWPAFNLADTIIFIGAILFLYNQFFTIERTYYEN